MIITIICNLILKNNLILACQNIFFVILPCHIACLSYEKTGQCGTTCGKAALLALFLII